jgi:small subunit ribosomal protein S29
MAALPSLRYFSRPTISSLPRGPRLVPILTWPTASLSTTATQALKSAAVSEASRGYNWKQKVKKTYKKKGATGTKSKKPDPGVRKAFRKRIQLSNINALAVDGLEDVGPATMAQGESKSRMAGLPDRLVDQLRALEAFKSTQYWGLFRRPHMLVRAETVELMKKLEGAAGDKQTLRLVLSGGKVSGKSIMLLQAMSYGLLNKWVVINIPEGLFTPFCAHRILY